MIVLARSSTGALIATDYSGGIWSGWYSLGGPTSGTFKAGSDPAAISSGPGRTDIFVRGTDDALWRLEWLGIMWGPWTSLGGALTSSPTVASWASDRMDVFVRGPGNTIWQKTYQTGVWSAWSNLAGGAVASAPAAVSWGTNRIDVFARSTNNSLLHKWWNGSAWMP